MHKLKWALIRISSLILKGMIFMKLSDIIAITQLLFSVDWSKVKSQFQKLIQALKRPKS